MDFDPLCLFLLLVVYDNDSVVSSHFMEAQYSVMKVPGAI